MTNEQIQALAREYAEEVYRNAHKEMEVLPNCLSNEAINMFAEDMEHKLKWLLRRYALVEKSTIKEAWSMITGVYLDHDHITYDGARYLFNEMLFPEIAKEVEG